MALHHVFTRATFAITVLDAVVMGLFGAIAASKALSLGVGGVGAVVVGVVGAIGGGVLRDLILNRPVTILHVGTLYAVAAGAGAGTLALLVDFNTPVPMAGLISAAVTASVRLAAVHFGWTFPEQGSLRLQFTRLHWHHWIPEVFRAEGKVESCRACIEHQARSMFVGPTR